MAQKGNINLIGTILSHYKILERIGKGGMGQVYKAQDQRLLRFVGLKILAPELMADKQKRARFIREAQTASSLNHPNICIIHEIDSIDNQYFIVMEFIEGETVRQHLRRGTLSEKQTISIALDVCDALKSVHKKGIYHRV